MRIRFFAVNRTQQRYFGELSDHLQCPAETVLCKKLLRPSPLCFYRFSEVIDTDILIRRKLKEHRNAGGLFAGSFGQAVLRRYLQMAIPLAAMRYVAQVADVRFDTIAVWNGKHLRQALIIQLAKALGKKTLFFENGMLPDTTVCDPKGVNADNSVPRSAAFYDAYESGGERHLPTELVVRASKKGTSQSDDGDWLPEGYVFVPFQVNHDTQITHHSPWIESMEALFACFETMAHRFPERRFVLKEHPSDPADYSAFYRKADALPNLDFANSVSTQTLIERACCVATINSSVGIEAMLYRTPVVVLGEAFYAIEGITFPAPSYDALEALLSRPIVPNDPERIRRFLEYLYEEYLIPGHWKTPNDYHFAALNERLGCHDTPPERALFLVSTPLHLYNAIVAALMFPERESHLFYIDQPDEASHGYVDALNAWTQTPFASVCLYKTRVKGSMAKWQARRKAFVDMEQAIASIAPHRVIVGNDRRIEFAYALHVARRIDSKVVGGYLDDGAYTYIAQASKWYQDTVIDIGLKKLVYGGWYFRPSVIGASDAVEEAYVALPEFANPALSQKHLIGLEMDRLLDPRLKGFTEALTAPYALDPHTVGALGLVFIVPHESLIAAFPTFQEVVTETIRDAARKGIAIGLKYHPRQEQSDPLGVLDLGGITVLPNTLAFEAMLPLLGRAVIVGDVSSALLTARWLRPDLKVLSLRNATDARQEKMAALFKHVGVEIVDPSDFQHTIQQEFDL